MKKTLLILLLFFFNYVYSQDFTYTYDQAPCARNLYTFTPQVNIAFDTLIWNYGDGYGDTTTSATNVTHSFIMAGAYDVKLTVKNSGAVVGSKTKKVYVYDKPNLQMSYEAPSLVCAPKDTVYLTVDSVNIEAPDLQFTISWGDGSEETFSKADLGDKKLHLYKKTSCGNTITIGNTEINDKFLITVSATNICSSVPVFMFRPVDIKSAPNVGFSISEQSDVNYDTLSQTYYVCGDGNIILNNDSYGKDNCLEVSNVKWTIYSGTTGIDSCLYGCDSVYQITNLDYGQYKITLTQENACGSSSVSRNIEIRELPNVSFLIASAAYCYPARLSFVNTSGDDVKIFWWDFIGDSSMVVVDTEKLDHEWIYKEAGTYTIKLWGSDGYCRNKSDTTVDLQQRCKDIYVPNAFLPESNNPDLNKFRPKAQDLLDYRIDIYDMYGKHIWSSTALDDNGCPIEGWDGTCPDGKPCPPGTYIWVIKATLSYGDLGTMEWDGQVYNKKGKRSTAGTFILIRN